MDTPSPAKRPAAKAKPSPKDAPVNKPAAKKETAKKETAKKPVSVKPVAPIKKVPAPAPQPAKPVLVKPVIVAEPVVVKPVLAKPVIAPPIEAPVVEKPVPAKPVLSVPVVTEGPKSSWFGRLKSGLQRSSGQLTESISGIFTKRKLDDAMLDELEEALITADMGVAVAMELRNSLAKDRLNKDVTDEEVKLHLASGIAAMLKPVAKPLQITDAGPFIISVVGVNGNGKTTTVAKLAKYYQDQGKKVMLAAADTFRAAAVEQLQVWGKRLGSTVIAGEAEADPASVAYRAVEQARKEKADILLIDTAGRLHNKTGLMQELQKIHRVLTKHDEAAPHATLLVLDATTGQNAHNQVKIFDEMVKVSGLIVTKLDGTAKGGVVVGLAREFGKPIHAIGVGESTEDLRPFDADEFAKALLGVA
ncbi:signal recognition particle-docking protein FtsY [bacterium]|nr:signal recognition particle-docking protein FtsY [bacterium]